MRIGIYDPYLDDLGGGEKYMMTLAECLASRHEVRIFWDRQTDFDELLKRFSLKLDNVHLTRNIFSQTVSFWERLFETKKYDVMIILTDGSIPFTLSKKLLLHIQQPLQQIDLTSWKGKLKQQKITGIFYNSQFTKSFNDRLFRGISSSILYPPVYWLQKNMKRENIIIHVGRFRPRNIDAQDFKKQNVMIEAFKKMVDDKLIKDWKFILATSVKQEDEEVFDKLKKAAHGYPIEFLMNKSNSELWDVYNTAKIYWHASGFGEDLQKHPEYAEHFGISTVEAMGVGVVPVVINAGGQKEIVADGENGFLWDTIAELHEKTIRIMKDQKLWERLSQNARMRAKDFSKETFCKKIHMLIES